MNNEQHQAERYERMTMAIALCEEFSFHVTFALIEYEDGNEVPAITVFLHKKWADELEYRLYKVGWVFGRVVPWSCFRVLTVVDRSSVV
jgi:nuclear transport factor 2 (NTF2) superfamily protein